MQRLGLEALTVFGMPPPAHVRLAAQLGCGHVSLALAPVPWKLEAFPAWSLREDAALRRELQQALRDTGVTIPVAEGYSVRAGVDARSFATDLDLLATLGVRHINGVCMERDLARGLEQLGIAADLAAERDMGFVLEFAPPHTIASLEQALAAIRQLGRRNLRLVVDAMHFFRSGGSVDALRAVPRELIGHVQLCDVPRTPPHDEYLKEACFERRVPGDGELPLAEFCAALPPDVGIGLEVPMLSVVTQSGGVAALAARAVSAARRLLESR